MKMWLLIAPLLGFNTIVSATEITRYGGVNAAGACQAALPVYDKDLRKRPIAIANEGTTDIFVSCSAPHHASLGSDLIEITLKNSSPTSVTVNCTLVEGAHSTAGLDYFYIPKSFAISAGATVDGIGWFAAADNQFGQNFWRVNFSCKLPPGVELGEISNRWSEDIGA